MRAWLLEDVTFRLSLIKRSFEKIAEISPYDDVLFENSEHYSSLEVNLSLPQQNFHLILHTLWLHHTHDILSTLKQAYEALYPDGLFLSTCFGGETFFELRQCFMEAQINLYGGAAPFFTPLFSIQDGGMLLQRAGFHLPVVDVERVTLSYDHVLDILRDIQAVGQVSPLLSKGKFSKSLLKEIEKIYAQKFMKDGKLIVTVDVLFLQGWTYEGSQPRPLLPGSAATSLKDVL